jgi:hypothetical protein
VHLPARVNIVSKEGLFLQGRYVITLDKDQVCGKGFLWLKPELRYDVFHILLVFRVARFGTNFGDQTSLHTSSIDRCRRSSLSYLAASRLGLLFR